MKKIEILNKKLEKTEGVKYCNVNLLAEKATIEFDESKIDDIIICTGGRKDRGCLEMKKYAYIDINRPNES